MLTTTLNAIRARSPCASGWNKLLRHLGKTKADDEPLPFAVILESNGLDDALWACRAAPQYDREWRLFAVWCARRAQHLMADPRSIAALDVAERYANGEATTKELRDAEAAARAAEAAARAASVRAVWAPASVRAEAAAARAAWAAAWAAAEAAGVVAWRAAVGAARASASAARAAAWAAEAAAHVTEREAQKAHFLEVVGAA